MVRAVALLLPFTVLAGCSAADDSVELPACEALDALARARVATLMPFLQGSDDALLRDVLDAFGDNVTQPLLDNPRPNTVKFGTGQGGEVELGRDAQGSFRFLVYTVHREPNETSQAKAQESLQALLGRFGLDEAAGLHHWTSGNGAAAEVLGPSHRAHAAQRVAGEDLASGHGRWATDQAVALVADEGGKPNRDGDVLFPPKLTFQLGPLYDLAAGVEDSALRSAADAMESARQAVLCRLAEEGEGQGEGVHGAVRPGLWVARTSLVRQVEVAYGDACASRPEVQEGKRLVSVDAVSGAIVADDLLGGCP